MTQKNYTFFVSVLCQINEKRFSLVTLSKKKFLLMNCIVLVHSESHTKCMCKCNTFHYSIIYQSFKALSPRLQLNWREEILKQLFLVGFSIAVLSLLGENHAFKKLPSPRVIQRRYYPILQNSIEKLKRPFVFKSTFIMYRNAICQEEEEQYWSHWWQIRSQRMAHEIY